MMRAFTESDWLVALHQIPGVGWHTINKIKKICGSFTQLPDRLSQHALELGSLRVPWQTIVEELTSQEMWQKIDKLKQTQIEIITVLNERYPELLKEIAQPPWVL